VDGEGSPGEGQMGKVRNCSSEAADRWRADGEGVAKGKKHEKERSASVIAGRYWVGTRRRWVQRG
jgi:hypothetical protein